MTQAGRHLPQVHLVILGHQGVGKSTFVQKALDLWALPSTSSSAKQMFLDGVIYVVRLTEVALDDIKVFDRRRVTWPNYVITKETDRIDGVLVLYDVTDQDSVTEVPEVLRKFTAPSLHIFKLSSCHCSQSSLRVLSTTQSSCWLIGLVMVC